MYEYTLQADNVTCHCMIYKGVYMCMDTPYRQIMSPVMVRYARGYICVWIHPTGRQCHLSLYDIPGGIYVYGYTLQADNVTCHCMIYKGVYMCMDTPYRQIMSPVMVRYTRGYICVWIHPTGR